MKILTPRAPRHRVREVFGEFLRRQLNLRAGFGPVHKIDSRGGAEARRKANHEDIDGVKVLTPRAPRAPRAQRLRVREAFGEFLRRQLILRAGFGLVHKIDSRGGAETRRKANHEDIDGVKVLTPRAPRLRVRWVFPFGLITVHFPLYSRLCFDPRSR